MGEHTEDMIPPRGRPLLSPGKPLNYVLKVRLTDEDAQGMKAKAEKQKIGCALWVRQLIRRAIGVRD